MKIVLCGGHLTPALALIEALQADKNVQILFFGRKFSTEGSGVFSNEYQIIKEKKIKFYEVTAGRLQRKFTKYTLFSLLKVPVGFCQSFVYLLIERPRLIVSFGGYISVPVVFTGWLLGIDSIGHEQASVPGLATKINSLFVKKIYLSWQQSLKFFDSYKTEVIGNLVRKSLFNKHPKSKQLADFIKNAKDLILITGGNQGSHVLNKLAFGLSNSLKNFYVLHQVGSLNWLGDLNRAKSIKRKNYLAVEYISPDDIGAVFRKASLVVSRSGANTVWDLALLKKPAIIIPLPVSSGNEQLENARILADVGMAIVVRQEELSINKVRQAIDKITSNHDKFQKAAVAFAKTLPQNGNAKMANFIKNYLKYA